MKKTLLFAAVLCGLSSFGVDPVAVWNGDFKTSTKGAYTLSANGNTVATDGSTITISTAKGVTFARSSALGNTVGMTVIYKFDNLVVGSTVKTIATASAGGGNADRVGVNVQTSGQTSGIWANTNTYDTRATQTTISSIASDGQFALVYGPKVTNNSGTYLYLKNGSSDYTLVYSCGGLKSEADTVQAMTVGGTRNNGGTFPAATGMVIKAVALFDQALTKDQIAAYEFPAMLVEKTVQFENFLTTTYQDTGWKMTLADLKASTTKITGTMDGSYVSGNNVAATGYHIKDGTDGSETILEFQMQIYQEGTSATDKYLKATRVYAKEQDGTIWLRAVASGNIQYGTLGTEITNWNGTLAQNATADGYGVASVTVTYLAAADTGTTATLSYEGDVTVSNVNSDLIDTDTKAEVTLADGATVYFDETLAVPTKLICEGSITLSAAEKPELSKLDLSGVTGGVIRTWMTEAEKSGIGFNFYNNQGGNTTIALAKTAWKSDANGNNGSNVAMTDDGLTTVTWTSNNVYTDLQSSGTILHGYLDDSAGVNITVSNVPFAEYAVIIYATTDTENAKLSYKTINGKNYTADGVSDVAKEGTDAWGQSRSSASAAYGTNAIRVVAQTKGYLVIHSANRSGARGCISAIQIVPYSTFVEPMVKISSVATQCSEDYASNMITGTISDYAANSWEGTISARVVVNSTVYSAEIDEKGAFMIEVSGLERETVYRTILEIGYTDGETFKAIATKSIALYQGERQYTWMASPIVLKEATTINDSQGSTVLVPTDMPDYVENCDSVFAVSISASEAVDAENDTESLEGVQGGVRIAEVDGSLKLQVVKNGIWTDFSAAEINKTYTLTVTFHYAKDENDTEPAVSYVLDKATVTGDNNTSKLKVTEVFIADGTVLPADLTGLFQFDSAVVVDIELKPGDEKVGIEAESDEEAQKIASNLKVGISEAVAAVLTSEKAQDDYRAYFKVVAVKTKDGTYTAQVVFADGVEDDIEKDIADAIDDVVESFTTGADVEIKAKPGLYYGVKRGETLESMEVKEDLQMAGADGKVTITITKPEGASAHFYRIIVSPTPAEAK